jgi:hypothetical protein
VATARGERRGSFRRRESCWTLGRCRSGNRAHHQLGGCSRPPIAIESATAALETILGGQDQPGQSRKTCLTSVAGAEVTETFRTAATRPPMTNTLADVASNQIQAMVKLVID